MLVKRIIARVRQVIGFCAGPMVIVCTAAILAGSPEHAGDAGQIDSERSAPQRTESIRLPATRPATAFH